MPRINSIIFIKIHLKIKLFLPKKYKIFECWGSASTPYASGGWGTFRRPHLPPMVGDLPPDPSIAPPHCRFLAKCLHEEKYTACYCRPPFILAFGCKYAWNVWRRRCSYSQTVYNTAKSISPGNT